jgi:hypothetical protein
MRSAADVTHGFEESKPYIEAWKLARQALEHENLLVNHRFTWFFQSQAFLFASFFVTLTNLDKTAKDHLLIVLPVMLFVIALLASYMCLVTHDGVNLANDELDRITIYYQQLQKRSGFSHWVPPLHNRDRSDIGTFDQRSIPLITLCVWSGAVIFLIYLQPMPLRVVAFVLFAIVAVWVLRKLSAKRERTKKARLKYQEDLISSWHDNADGHPSS